MFSLLFLTVYTLIYYFLIYKKTKHLDLTKETINMFKTDFATSFYISVLYFLFLISLINYIFFTNFLKFYLIDLLGALFIIFSGIIEFNAIINLKENYYPQIRKEKYLVTSGIYKYIRHPIYLSGIFLSFGTFILFSKNLIYILLPIVFLVIIYKVESEEKYLKKRFKGYKLYQKTSNKLFPYIY